jgi:amidase
MLILQKTSGSIASPARNNGVVGLKPTAGLISRFGVYSVTEWQDSVGVFAKTIRDAALVLTAIAGKRCSPVLMNPADEQVGFDEGDAFAGTDPRDHSGLKRPEDGTDFAAACDEASLKGIRIAVRLTSVRLFSKANADTRTRCLGMSSIAMSL